MVIYTQSAPVPANFDVGVLLATTLKRRLYPGVSECLCAGKCSSSPSSTCSSGSARISQQRAAEPRSCSQGLGVRQLPRPGSASLREAQQ